jgi:hypothetical protein
MKLTTSILLGGVGHCFAWHVRVSPFFGFNFKIEELIQSAVSGLHTMYTTNHLFLCEKLEYDKLKYLTGFGLKK